jgi:hypothetical protein
MKPYRLSPGEVGLLKRLVKDQASEEDAFRAISRVGSLMGVHAIHVGAALFGERIRSLTTAKSNPEHEKEDAEWVRNLAW